MREFKIKEKNGFYYVEVGCYKWKPSWILWINRTLKSDEILKFPLLNAKIEVTQKGNRVLRPADGWWVACVYVPALRRACTTLIYKYPLFGTRKEYEENNVFYFVIDSRASLGHSMGALINVPPGYDKTVIYYNRDRYAEDEFRKYGFVVIYKDGQVEILPELGWKEYNPFE
ncbi:hypothetical protein [Caldisericum sp.]|uniref:hypothetical protein n=1 Tax=Caldisericum sp. TaxID=2499687 RepID=UPI003D0C0F06